MATPKNQRDSPDRTEFERKQWERFVEILDRPANLKPELRRLFSKPSVFSGG